MCKVISTCPTKVEAACVCSVRTFWCWGFALALCGQASFTRAEDFTFVTFAGLPNAGAGAIDATNTAARFNSPASVAVDANGNLYVADSLNHTIRKIATNGVVSTLAGVAPLLGTNDGIGGTARFESPTGVAVDPAGNVYVADSWNHTVRKISPAGFVTTLAGQAGSPGTNNGPGSVARFGNPRGIALDSATNLYVADSSNATIRKISPDGVVITLAGLAGSPGTNDGIGAAARFNQPGAVATDTAGNVYVADTANHAIRKISPVGSVTTLAGQPGTFGSADGTGRVARFESPHGLTVDTAGQVYVADTYNRVIRRITPAGVVTTWAGTKGVSGSADGTLLTAQFDLPWGIAIDGFGQVYLADIGNHTVRKITQAGTVSTLAGRAAEMGSADGTGSGVRFHTPLGLASDNGTNLYVSDSGNHTVRKITPSGLVSTWAGLARATGTNDGVGSAARFNSPSGLGVDRATNLYVADTWNHTIRKISPAGVVTTLAGMAGVNGSADGTNASASFNFPTGLAVDRQTNVYVVDTDSHTVRKITPRGVVTTLAGLAGARGTNDGVGSAARFSSPYGIAVDRNTNVFVADTFNNTIRKIAPDGTVTTFAGAARVRGTNDGMGSAARFDGPFGLMIDSATNLLVADLGNGLVRRISPNGLVTTLAGRAGYSGSTDGTGADAEFYSPRAVTVDRANAIYVAGANHTIRKGTVAGPDQPFVDLAEGPVGVQRRFDVTNQTITSRSWSRIRKPSNSESNLSSFTARRPTFTPDVPDVWVFRFGTTNASGQMALRTISVRASAVELGLDIELAEPSPQTKLTLHSPPGLPVQLQISSNLLDWANLLTFTNLTGSDAWLTPATNRPGLFYRLRY